MPIDLSVTSCHNSHCAVDCSFFGAREAKLEMIFFSASLCDMYTKEAAMRRLPSLLLLLVLVLLATAAPERRAKRARLDRQDVVLPRQRSLADLPVELVHQVMDHLPLNDLLRLAQSSRYYAKHVKSVLRRQREVGRQFNAQWAYRQLPVGHAWFNETDALAHFDYEYPLELCVRPHLYSEAINEAFLQREDEMLGSVRALYRFFSSVCSPMRFVVDASGWLMTPNTTRTLQKLKHLDGLVIDSRVQFWDDGTSPILSCRPDLL